VVIPAGSPRWSAPRAVAAASLALMIGIIGGGSGAKSAEFGLQTLSCQGTPVLQPDAPGAEAQARIAFDATVIYADGEFLSLLDPEKNKVERRVSDQEVTRGTLEFVDREPEPMVWTLSTGRKATMMGFSLRSDGGLMALTIRSAPDGESRRPFVLFDQRSGGVHRGWCR
jgi:hypothetical protein